MGTQTIKVWPEETGWRVEQAFPGVRLKTLFIDDQNGQKYELQETIVDECVEPRHTHRKGGHSLYVVQGEILDANTNEVVVPEGGFWHAPKDDVHGPFKTHQGTLLLFVGDCQLDFVVVDK